MKKKLNILVISALFFVILAAYQNCGTEQQGSLFASKSNSTVPYEMAIDQIAYMSCAEQSGVANDSGVFYTLRAGAYGANAGVRLSENFLYTYRRKNDAGRLDVLYEDAGTTLSRLQFSIRRQAQLNSMYVNQTSGGGTEEVDFDFVFGDFGSDAMSASLLGADVGKYINYWSPAGVNKDAFFEGTLVFNSSELLAQDIRRFFSSEGILALAFAEVTNPATLRTPADYDSLNDEAETENENGNVISNQALGVGFKLDFRQPSVLNWGYAGAAHVNMPKRVLSSVSERDLSNPNKSVTSNWACPADLQFRILFPDDIWRVGAPKDPSNNANFADNPGAPATKLCPQRNDNHADNTGVYAARLAYARRSLPISDWYINVRHQCVIPKRYTKGSCYGVDQGTNDTRSPEYNVTARCNADINTTGIGVCSHFLSVCYKPE